MPRLSHRRIVTPGSARADASGSASPDLHRWATPTAGAA